MSKHFYFLNICAIIFGMFDLFGSWLQEQEDRKDDVGEFARLCWTAFTAGDCRYYSHVMDWRAFFQRRLSAEKFEKADALLKCAFAEYAEEVLHAQEVRNVQ